MRYKTIITKDVLGAKSYKFKPIDEDGKLIDLSSAMTVIRKLDSNNPLASYKTRAWTKVQDGDIVDIPNISTGIRFRGERVRISDSFIHWNTHHIIHYHIRIINGEFKAVGYYIGAKKPRRVIIRSLSRLFHAAKTKGHKLVRATPRELDDFCSLGKNNGIDWWSQGDNMDEQYEKMLLVLKPVVDNMYVKQLNWRKEQ